MWKRVGSILRFSFDECGGFALDSTCFATGDEIKFLCCVLNSPMGHYLLKDAPQTGTGDLLISVQAVEPIRIPIIKDTSIIDKLFEEKMAGANNEADINNYIYSLYNLDADEIARIESIDD